MLRKPVVNGPGAIKTHSTSADTYNWDADAPGRYFLYQAQEVGGDDLKITMFVNSAPAAMTLDHASCGTSFANGE